MAAAYLASVRHDMFSHAMFGAEISASGLGALEVGAFPTANWANIARPPPSGVAMPSFFNEQSARQLQTAQYLPASGPTYPAHNRIAQPQEHDGHDSEIDKA